MTVVDAIGQLPLPPSFGFSISSPFNELPLRNFSGSSVNDIEVANTVKVNSIQMLTFPTGDFNLDDAVDAADAAILTAHLGLSTGALLTDGDVDEDGDVDRIDLAIWQAHGALAVSRFCPERGHHGLPRAVHLGGREKLRSPVCWRDRLRPDVECGPGQSSHAGGAVVTTVTGNVSALVTPKARSRTTKRVFFRVVLLP